MARDVMSVRLHLPQIRVLEVLEDTPGALVVSVESTFRRLRCPQCGFKCHRVHDRRDKKVRDLEVSGRRTLLVWSRRRTDSTTTCKLCLGWRAMCSTTAPSAGISCNGALAIRPTARTAKRTLTRAVGKYSRALSAALPRTRPTQCGFSHWTRRRGHWALSSRAGEHCRPTSSGRSTSSRSMKTILPGCAKPGTKNWATT